MHIGCCLLSATLLSINICVNSQRGDSLNWQNQTTHIQFPHSQTQEDEDSVSCLHRRGPVVKSVCFGVLEWVFRMQEYDCFSFVKKILSWTVVF